MLACTLACAVIGAHIATAHDTGGKQGFNPGLYVRQDSGLVVGAYRNSYGRFSAYAGWTFETDSRTFALTVGAVSGYPAAKVLPVAVPSVRFGLADQWAARLSLLPKPPKHGTATGLHLSLEKEF